MRAHMTELAFLRLPDGRAWLGEGPFEALTAPPASGAAFYINDFDLADPAPWKKPARLHTVDAASLGAWAGDDSATLKILWQKPATEWFKMAFRRIRREVLGGRLAKMVPVLTKRGTRRAGRMEQLLRRIHDSPANLWAYAHVQGDSGFLGATPELLFRLKDGGIETMALAGTAKPGDQKDFLSDVKEIQEHELVVSYLMDQLSGCASVERGERGLLETAGLLHFQTLIRGRLKNPVPVNDLIALLHPTPAVGCLPRSGEWLAKLREYRSQLHAPGFFGAPFGLSLDGETTLAVAIRGLCWRGEEVLMPSGCGIVGGSAFDHEWRELRLKHDAACKLLGL
jgi:menaquinone-specific isochorismate synthase